MAVQRLLALKGRQAAKGLILIAAGLDQIEPFMSYAAEDIPRAIRATWPGPVTWLLPVADATPDWLTGGRDTIAVRVTAHPVASALCRTCAMALVSTSANLSGRPPARRALQVRLAFGARLDYVVHGSVGPSPRPTPIRDAATGRFIRT